MNEQRTKDVMAYVEKEEEDGFDLADDFRYIFNI